MSMLVELHHQAVGEFGARVERIGDDQWQLPTPCTEWDVWALVNHVADEARWAPYLLGGGTVDQAGDRFAGAALGGDAKVSWRELSELAQAAFAAPEALEVHVSVSAGDISARDYLWQMTVDATVHAWDLARGIGADERLDHELVRRIYAEMERDPEPLGPGFDPPVSVSANADLQTRMLALFGRRA